MAKQDNHDKILMTQEGLNELKKELDELRSQKRPKAVDRLQTAREMGDLSENSEYTSARQDLDFMDERIEELEEKLRHAKVVSKSKTGKTVSFGSKATLKTGNQTVVYTIVGEGESDPAENKISHNSPLGEAVMDKRAGDSVQVNAPAGKVEYTVVKVEK
jgi:transcription elongation factor GreA